MAPTPRQQGGIRAVTFRENSRAIKDFLSSSDGAVAKELGRLALGVERRAKRSCPVDTGRLRSSIAWRLEADTRGISAVIGTNVEYAPYVELGTSQQPARPFLRPALQGARRGGAS